LEVTNADGDNVATEPFEGLQVEVRDGSDSDSVGEDAYTSSDESEDEDPEAFSAEKRKHPTSGYQGPKKHARTNLPKRREPFKPVQNPLTEEQKAQRKQTGKEIVLSFLTKTALSFVPFLLRSKTSW
jgi:hypothetical protein